VRQIRNAISPGKFRKEMGVGQNLLVRGKYAHTCAERIDSEGAGEECICDSLLFQIEHDVLPDKRQGVDCSDSCPFSTGEKTHKSSYGGVGGHTYIGHIKEGWKNDDRDAHIPYDVASIELKGIEHK
jgi:hypothetical protein